MGERKCYKISLYVCKLLLNLLDIKINNFTLSLNDLYNVLNAGNQSIAQTSGYIYVCVCVCVRVCVCIRVDVCMYYDY
jgi:hypothetical protein